jgi:protein arginine N-methyltransferase 3
LPLHTVTLEELIFTKEFSVTLAGDIDCLDGFAVWFDMFFMPTHDSTVPENAIPDDMVKKGHVAFTTGPEGPETHWQTGILLVDNGKKSPTPLKRGQVIKGQVGYKKKEEKSRLLDIEVQWDIQGVEKGNQSWSLQ